MYNLALALHVTLNDRNKSIINLSIIIAGDSEIRISLRQVQRNDRSKIFLYS
jgi:hypothetical protein